MTGRHPCSSRLPRWLRPVLAVTLLLGGTTLVPAPAEAMGPATVERMMRAAASKEGAPYRYGAEGPRRFDCSGYTMWAFARVGRHLPRTSAAQSRYARPVSRSHRRRGDLVFFRSHGRVYHVAIYAGRNRIWHAPSPGERVRRERLWTRSVRYGRVR